MSSKPLLLDLSSEFRVQLRQIKHFYAREAGESVARSFVVSVSAVLERVAHFPEMGEVYQPPEAFKSLQALHYRKLNLSISSPFPYGIYYQIDKNRLVMRAIHHHSMLHDRLLER